MIRRSAAVRSGREVLVEPALELGGRELEVVAVERLEEDLAGLVGRAQPELVLEVPVRASEKEVGGSSAL